MISPLVFCHSPSWPACSFSILWYFFSFLLLLFWNFLRWVRLWYERHWLWIAKSLSFLLWFNQLCWISWSHVAYGDNSQCTYREKKKLKCDNDYRKSGTFHNFSTCLTLHTGFAYGIITYFVVVAVVVVLFIVDAKVVAVAVIAATVLVLRYLFDSPAIVGSTQATAPTMHSTLLHVGCKYCHLSRANTK